MKKIKFKKMLAVILSMATVISLSACNSGGNNEGGSKTSEGTKSTASTSANASTGSEVSIDTIKLGEDYKDIKADLKFLTHRTDIIDTTFKEYISEFQKLYPNVNIDYEGITDYASDITTRLTTGDWGDICMIPTSIDKNELENYFVKLGDKETLSKTYRSDLLNNFTYNNAVYGIPSVSNVYGIVYNKAVFEKAGVSAVPKTPDEFLEALKKIKDNTSAIPMYTNFAAGWTMTAWDGYIDGGATGDADFVNTGLTKGKNPFADRGDGTGPYAVYNTLYEAVKRGLTEEDPTTTDWEGSKGKLNNGEIGCMALGSWSIVQMQQAGEHADDIGYMAFPITVNGKQYIGAGPDYNYGINKNSSEDNKIAAMCYIKWLLEKSGFAQNQGGISAVSADEYPAVFKALDGVELVVNNPAKEGEENLFSEINNDSELGINVSGAIATKIVEEAVSGKATMKEMSDEWNEKWTAAQEKHGITN